MTEESNLTALIDLALAEDVGPGDWTTEWTVARGARGEAVIDHTPYGRFGQAQELAGATLFLASNKAAGFVTGICIPVDGGYLAYNI